MNMRDLVNKTFRDTRTGTLYKFIEFTPDPDEPDTVENHYLGEMTIEYDGKRHQWFGHEIESDFERGTLVLVS